MPLPRRSDFHTSKLHDQRDKHWYGKGENDAGDKGVDGDTLVSGTHHNGQNGVHRRGAGQGDTFNEAQALGNDGNEKDGTHLPHNIGEKSHGGEGGRIGGEEHGCQGIPTKTGAGGHGLLGGEGQEKAAYGGKADGPHGYSDRDQKDLKAGGPDIPPDVALPPHVHTHQKED